MAIDVQRIRLDISKQPTQQVVRLGQGDANGTTLECSIYDEGQAYSLTGKTVLLRIQLPGGYAEYHVGGTVSGNVATFQVDEAYAASVAGTTDNAYVEVLQGGTVVCSTSRFRVVVLPSAYEGTDPAHIWDNGITGFLQSANAQVRELTDEAERAISDARAQQAEAAAELDAALDALGDVSELAVPLMSATTRGGAMLGSGLAVSDGRLRTNLVESASGSANAPMTASGDLLHGLTVQGCSVQDGTPTPDAPVEVRSVRGRNLATLTELVTSQTGYANQNNAVIGAVVAGGQYTISANVVIASAFSLFFAGSSTRQGDFSPTSTGRYSVTFIAAESGTLYFYGSGKTANAKYLDSIQLELGSTPTPYVPYGSIGIAVSGPNLLPSITPIPLQGNVLASLPDGTHDELTVDALGRVKLVKRVGKYTITGNESVAIASKLDSFIRVSIDSLINQRAPAGATTGYCSKAPYMTSNTEQALHVFAYDGRVLMFYESSDTTGAETLAAFANAEIFYNLATPQIIDLGTIELPKLADGATVEVVASLSTPTVADWWALGAGAVGDGLLLLRDEIDNL